jgi:phosphoglucomutase
VLIRNKPGLKALVAILRDPPRSGTENTYEIYAESFRGVDYLRRILVEARAIVNHALAAVPSEKDRDVKS